MSDYTNGAGYALDWDDEIQYTESSFVLLPAGEYPFTVTGFDRQGETVRQPVQEQERGGPDQQPGGALPSAGTRRSGRCPGLPSSGAAAGSGSAGTPVAAAGSADRHGRVPATGPGG